MGFVGDGESSSEESNAMSVYGDFENSCSNVDIVVLEETCYPPQDLLNQPVHFYVYICDGEDSTYEPCEKNVIINLDF